MARKLNFGAGPSQLPLPVLERAAQEMLNYHDSGMSVLELSHRSVLYESLHNQAIADLRSLLGISEEFSVLFTQGGARMQFDAVPLNLATRFPVGNYLVSGYWSDMAEVWARKYTRTQAIPYSNDSTLWNCGSPGYFYYCSNETIDGVEWLPSAADLQSVSSLAIVADMSSNILTTPIPCSSLGVFFAGAQKNLGPAGVTVSVVRKDLLGSAQSFAPSLLDWQLLDQQNSMYNTPPTYMIYMLGLYLDYVKKQGGVQSFYEESVRKSGAIYEVVDSSQGFYTSRVPRARRSRVNIPLSIRNGDAALEKEFLLQAERRGMTQLAGHKSAGGLRVSLYNGISEADTQQLADFMREFAAEHC